MFAVVITSALADTRLFLPISQPATRPLEAAVAQGPAPVFEVPNTAAEFAYGGVPMPNSAAGFEYVVMPAEPQSSIDGWTLLAFAAGGLALGAAARPAMAMFGVAGQDLKARGWTMNDITPDGKLSQRVEGKTRKTWKFNDVTKDRVQVALSSTGRPVNADVQLWLGPDWTPMKLKTYSEDGSLRPVQTLIGTRNKQAMIEVKNVGEYEFPISAASNYAQGAMAQVPQEIITTTEGVRVDGGALRSFPVDPSTKQLEVVLNTDGRQLNARIEILNAPNNPKQTYEIFTNNGELNCLCVCFNIVDAGNTVRVVNLAPVEFPLNIHVNEN